jgi:drug/metabolite transporter (DMT)-like permease
MNDPSAVSANVGIVRCSIAAALFGISAPLASQLAGDMGPFTLAGLVYLGAAAAVGPMACGSLPTRETVQRARRRLALAVLFGGGVGPVLLAAGLSRVPAATASLLLNLELVATTVLAGLVFREHLGRRVLLGTGLVVAGGVLLGWSSDASFRWGAILIAAACVCWAIDNCVTANVDELSPSHITFVKGIVAGSTNLAIGVGAEGGLAVSMPSVGSALFVGALGYGASITLWVAGARDLGAARAQLVFATAPFVGAAVSWVAFAERIEARQVLSLLLVAIGVLSVIGSSHTHVHAHEAIEHDHEHSHDDGHHDHLHADGFAGRHAHTHRHQPLEHAHAHVPDLHHRHGHR